MPYNQVPPFRLRNTKDTLRIQHEWCTSLSNLRNSNACNYLKFCIYFFDSKQTSLRNAPSYSPSFFPQHSSTCLHTTALLFRAKLLFHSKIVAYKMQPAHPNITFLNFLHKEQVTFDQSSSINYHCELHLQIVLATDSHFVVNPTLWFG